MIEAGHLQNVNAPEAMMPRYVQLRPLDMALKSALGITGVLLMLSVAAAPALAGYYFRYDGDVQGKIFDADTRRPLEGVVVMAMWVTQHTRITIEPEERYFDYFETRTNAKGEFTVPGKGQNVFRNMPPPKIKIYKSGYPIRSIRYSITDLSPSLEIKIEDGKRIVFYQKWPVDMRKKYVKQYRPIPYFKMAMTVPKSKYQLYLSELAKDYQAVGIRPRQYGAPVLIKKGGVYPATNQPVLPRHSK